MLAHRQDDNNRHATRHQVSDLRTVEQLLPSERKNLQCVPARAAPCVPRETGAAAGGTRGAGAMLRTVFAVYFEG